MRKPLEGQLLKAWREARGLSQDELGSRLDIPADGSEFSRYERGRSSPSVKTLLNLISGLDIPGRDDAERLAAFFRGPESAETPWVPGRTRNIPVVDEPVAAGVARLAEHASAVVEFPLSLLELFLGEPPAAEPDRYCLVDVHGTSMVPTIPDRARLLVDRGPGSGGWPEIVQGDVYVIVPPTEDGGTTKRLFLTDEELIAWPDNPSESPRYWSRRMLREMDVALAGIARARVLAVLSTPQRGGPPWPPVKAVHRREKKP